MITFIIITITLITITITILIVLFVLFLRIPLSHHLLHTLTHTHHYYSAGDFSVMCRFGGHHAMTRDKTTLIFKYQNNTGRWATRIFLFLNSCLLLMVMVYFYLLLTFYFFFFFLLFLFLLSISYFSS